MLNIAYNTSRLQKIIDEFKERQSFVQLRKSQNRGKAAAQHEIAEAVKDYLQGESIATIAKSLYRSTGFVKAIIERVGVPARPSSAVERRGMAYLPEECVAEEFEPGEIVWSAKYHAPAEIKYELSIDYQAEKAGCSDVNYEKKYGSKGYTIWVREPISTSDDFSFGDVNTGGFFAAALAYDLGSLKHLEKYGVDLSRI